MRLRYNYKNGNVTTKIYTDGTKVHLLPTNEEIKTEFPESIDLKITNYCPIGCEFCHENATNNREEKRVINHEFLMNLANSVHKGTEFAVGGGALSSIENLENSLFTLKVLGDCIVNITINSKELRNEKFMKDLVQMRYLISGIGISYNKEDRDLMLELKRKWPNNVVIHTICGLLDDDDLKFLTENHFKILFLGYKHFGRGDGYFERNSETIEKNIEYLKQNIFQLVKGARTVSFDNLALEQLDIKNQVTEEEWNKYYMGDEGQFSCYIDGVSQTMGINSTAPLSERIPCSDLEDKSDLKNLFNTLKTNSYKNNS